MTNNSIDLWKSWKDAQLKYDYYITGLITALFAYIGSKYVPEPFSFSQNTIELLALLFFVISLISALKRLENDLSIQTISLKKSEAQKRIQDLKNIQHIEISFIEINKQIDLAKKYISDADAHFEKMSRIGNVMFYIRNWSLLLGFILLITSKLVGTYLLTI